MKAYVVLASIFAMVAGTTAIVASTQIPTSHGGAQFRLATALDRFATIYGTWTTSDSCDAMLWEISADRVRFKIFEEGRWKTMGDNPDRVRPDGFLQPVGQPSGKQIALEYFDQAQMGYPSFPGDPPGRPFALVYHVIDANTLVNSTTIFGRGDYPGWTKDPADRPTVWHRCVMG